MRNFYLYISIRLLLLLSILFLSNYLYEKYLYKDDLIIHADILDDLNNVIKETDIIYLAESSNLACADNDKDKRRLSEFINDYFPNVKIGRVNKGALHSGIYLTLLKNIDDSVNLNTVIITMNLRSFGEDWINSKLETPLMKMNEFMNPYLPKILNRFILSLNTFNNLNDEERSNRVKSKWKEENLNIPNFYKNVYEWDKDIFHKGILDSLGNRDNDKTNLTLQYVKNYAFTINTFDNPRIQNFDEITELCKLKKWNLIFNIVSENVEKAKELCGDELIKLMRKNRDILVNRYTKKGVVVVDNLELVPDSMFIDKDFPTEHYNEFGRRIVAKNVANKLKAFIKD